MRILVTGGLGFIGHEVVRMLREALTNTEIIVVDDCSNNLVDWDETEADSCYTATLRDFADTTSLRFDLIIHCASPVGHAQLVRGEGVLEKMNSSTQALLDLVQPQPKARIIAFSSSEVLAYKGQTDTRGQYSLGKLSMESRLFDAKVDYQVIRPFNVVGPKQKALGGFVMARFREQWLKGDPITIFGNGTQLRYYTHVSDLVRFVRLLSEKWPTWNRLWHPVVMANRCSVKQLAESFGGRWTLTEGVKEFNNPDWRETGERLFNEALVRQHLCELGWYPQYSLLDIIQELKQGKAL